MCLRDALESCGRAIRFYCCGQVGSQEYSELTNPARLISSTPGIGRNRQLGIFRTRNIVYSVNGILHVSSTDPDMSLLQLRCSDRNCHQHFSLHGGESLPRIKNPSDFLMKVAPFGDGNTIPSRYFGGEQEKKNGTRIGWMQEDRKPTAALALFTARWLAPKKTASTSSRLGPVQGQRKSPSRAHVGASRGRCRK